MINMEVEISVVVAVIGVVTAILTFFVGRQSSAKNQGIQDGQILSELGYLKSNTDDIKKRLDKQDERNMEFITRLTAVESATKQAHKRIDAWEAGYERD